MTIRPASRTAARAAGSILTTALLGGLLVACSSGSGQEAEAAPAAGAITVTDQRDQKVTLDAPAERIASAVIPAPAIIAAVDGSWDRIVGINQSLLDANKLGIISKIFPESIDTPVVAGRDFVPNMEEILALEPDVMVQWGYLGEDFISPIETAGIPVVGLEYGTQEDLETWITLFGDVIGKEDRSGEIISWMHEEEAAIEDTVHALDA